MISFIFHHILDFFYTRLVVPSLSSVLIGDSSLTPGRQNPSKDERNWEKKKYVEKSADKLFPRRMSDGKYIFLQYKINWSLTGFLFGSSIILNSIRIFPSRGWTGMLFVTPKDFVLDAVRRMTKKNKMSAVLSWDTAMVAGAVILQHSKGLLCCELTSQ